MPDLGELWTISVLATRVLGEAFHTNHAPGLVAARSRAEADGKALQVARKLYPADEGWRWHVCSAPAEVVDPAVDLRRVVVD